MQAATPSEGGGGGGDHLESCAIIPNQMRWAKLSQYKRTRQTMGRYPLEFDVLRRKAEARVGVGGAPPDRFASILRMQNAGLSRNGKSLLPASVQRLSDLPLATKQMRRALNPCSRPARKDALSATDWDMDSGGEDPPYET